MSSNLTVDDSSADILYSDNWTKQLPNDPTALEFFQSTYHGAQADGASANITFTGSAIYLFGSTGPGHGNYSVQLDNLIIFLSANALEMKYQQPLFHFSFNTSGPHFLSFTGHPFGDANWVDLDYITITVADGSSGNPTNPQTGNVPSSQTISPPWLNQAPSTAVQSIKYGSSTNGAFQSSTSAANATANISKLTLSLSIAFGAIIAIALTIAVLCFCLNRRHAKLSRREDDFRYGSQQDSSHHSGGRYAHTRTNPSISTTAPSMSEFTPAAHQPHAPTFSPPPEASRIGARSPWSPSFMSKRSASPLSTNTNTRLLSAAAGSRTLASPSPMHVLPEKREHSEHRVNGPVPKRPQRSGENLLDWLGSGIAWNPIRNHPPHKDGNSMKTDFLQV